MLSDLDYMIYLKYFYYHSLNDWTLCKIVLQSLYLEIPVILILFRIPLLFRRLTKSFLLYHLVICIIRARGGRNGSL